MKKRELDLHRSCRLRSRRETESVWLRAFYLPALLILTAGLCTWIVLGMQSRALEQEVTALTAELAEDADRYHEAELKWAYNQALMDRAAAAEELTAALATYPRITSDLIDSVDAVGGEAVRMTLRGYDASTGMMEFRAQSSAVMDIPAYILSLRQTGLFSAVAYSGYRYDGGVYHLDIKCTLRERGQP